MSSNANENYYTLRQGTRTGPDYLAAFERAHAAVHPQPSHADAKARLIYGANEKVQKAIIKNNEASDGAALLDAITLEGIKEAIRTTTNPAHHSPHAQHPPAAPAATPQYYYADAGGGFQGTTGPVGTINPGWQ